MKFNRVLKTAVSLPLMLLIVFAISATASAKGCPQCGAPITATEVMDPFCETEGHASYQCTSCPYGYSVTLPALGHNYKSTTSATCTQPGTKTYTCSRCHDSYDEKAGPLGHKYTVETDEYCEEDGTAAYYCVRCGDSYTVKLDPLGHAMEKTVTEPTCELDGEEVETCTRCGKTITTVLPAPGHSYETEETPPTCTEPGHRSGKCSVCGAEISEELPAAGHSYETEETAPTCTEPGIKSGKCSVCGDNYSEEIPAAGHRFGEWTVKTAPTVFHTGEEVRTCSEGDASESNILPKKAIKESPVAIGGIAMLVIGIITVIALAVKSAAAASAASAAAAETSSLGMIALEMKHLLICLQDNEKNKELLKLLRKRPYLDIKTTAYGDSSELVKKAGKEKPDLIVLSSADTAALMNSMAEISAVYHDAAFAVIDETNLDSVALNALKEQGKIMSFASASENAERKIVKLALPLYKPSQSASAWAENAALITDALGFPIISLLLSAFVTGSDVVDVVKSRSLDVSDTADIVSDVAWVLGFDTLSVIANTLRIGADQAERVSDNKAQNNND